MVSSVFRTIARGKCMAKAGVTATNALGTLGVTAAVKGLLNQAGNDMSDMRRILHPNHPFPTSVGRYTALGGAVKAAGPIAVRVIAGLAVGYSIGAASACRENPLSY